MLIGPSHPSETKDRKIQALHNRITNNSNAQATAIDNGNWDRLTELQEENVILTSVLDKAMGEKY